MICDVSAGSSKRCLRIFGRGDHLLRLREGVVKKFLSGYSKFPVHVGIRPWRWPLKIDRLTLPLAAGA